MCCLLHRLPLFVANSNNALETQMTVKNHPLGVCIIGPSSYRGARYKYKVIELGCRPGTGDTNRYTMFSCGSLVSAVKRLLWIDQCLPARGDHVLTEQAD